LILNIFYPLKREKTGYSKKDEDVGLKADFKSASNRFISEEVAGLSFGYLLGEKDELPPGVEGKMKTVGLAHIIVVSGTHLSIIISASRKLFEKMSRFAALYFSVFLLIMYVSLIGWTPSTTRASFVAIMSIIAWFFGRKQLVFRTVLLTLGSCLLINPYYLTNVSFQLSMLAYSGVVLILPLMIRYFYGRDKPGFVGSVVLSSLAAIIACLPIQMYYFGSMNLLSLLANLLILPTIPYVMCLSFLTGLLSLIHFDFLASGLGWLAELVLKYHVRTINILEDKSEFLFEVQKNNPIWLLIYIPMALAVVFMWQKHVKVSDNDADSRNNSTILGDEVENVFAEVIERNNSSNKASTKRYDKN
jgi:competence protein ComEC